MSLNFDLNVIANHTAYIYKFNIVTQTLRYAKT